MRIRVLWGGLKLSDVQDGSRPIKTYFTMPRPKYTKDHEMLRGRLKCPLCGGKIACRVEIRGLTF